jgi:hypothetical protein
MHPTSKTALVLPAALFATLGLPSATSAQHRLPTITTVVAADSLHASAVTMAQTTYRWRDAASLHRRSSALRPAADSMGFRCLTSAAHLSFAADDLASAQSDMEEAAAHALARGDVEKAAHAYADAAWVARERKHPARASELGRQAEVLASSPLLSSTKRIGILERFVHPGRNLAADEKR